MPLNWNALSRPIIALSPMADMTDSAFCRVVKEVLRSTAGDASGMEPVVERSETKATDGQIQARTTGPSENLSGKGAVAGPAEQLIVFREMVSAEAVVRGNNKTLDMTAIHNDERPLVQQIFGSDPATMAEAARKIADEHAPEGFDINMGCPVYKIVHNFNGCALMNEPERAAAIVRGVKSAISVPLSVKIRLGWDDPTQSIEFAKVLEEAGADLLTVHGRTKAQGYSGVADWHAVGRVKAAVRIPVLCNGDVHTAQAVPRALAESGCDGVLIARGALGNPWIFRDIQDVLRQQTPEPVTFGTRMDVVRRHLALHIAQYGDHAVPLFRKHLSWYFKGLPGMKVYKEPMMKAQTHEELAAVFAAFSAAHDANDTQSFRPTTLLGK